MRRPRPAGSSTASWRVPDAARSGRGISGKAGSGCPAPVASGPGRDSASRSLDRSSWVRFTRQVYRAGPAERAADDARILGRVGPRGRACLSRRVRLEGFGSSVRHVTVCSMHGARVMRLVVALAGRVIHSARHSWGSGGHMRDDRRAASRIERGVAPLAAAVAAALGASIIDTAFAQDGVSEEVIVTASRRETTVRELPFNIHAMSGAVLEEQRIRDLADLARWVPGLTVVDQGGRAGNLMTVRGLNVTSLNATEFLNNSSGDNVQTYLGEIPLYVDLKMHDIERVEVLIGPQGTLYGAGTLGGAVRYIPRAPDASRFSMELYGDAFSVAHGGSGFEGDFTVNVPLVDERVALRASLGWLDDPGFIDYPYLVREPGVSDPEPDRSDPAAVAANLWRQDDANWEETLSGRVALLVQPSDRLQATFSYYFQDQKAGGRTANHRDAFGTGRYESGHRFLEPNDRRN